MTINWKTILGGVCLFIGFCIKTSLGQVTCSNYTLVQLPGTMPTNGITIQNTEMSACESSCLSDTSCYGFTSMYSTCILNTYSPDALNYSFSSPADYYNLIRNYSDCDSAHSCSYLWFPWIRSHGTGGTNANLNSLSDCIKFCQDSTSCVFVDWNAQDKSCWTYTSVPDMYEAINMYSFRKYCSVPRTATQQPSAPLQNTTSTPATAASSIKIISPSSNTTTSPTTNSTITILSASSSSSSNHVSISTTSTPVYTKTASDFYQFGDDGGEYASYPMTIKPAYIVLAGLGGGCLLLVLIAVIILCQYLLRGPESCYSSSESLVKESRGVYAKQDINMSSAAAAEEGEGGGGEDNVGYSIHARGSWG